VDRDPHRRELLDRATQACLEGVRGERWLDAGCGEGRLARVLARRGATVLGVDIAPTLIGAARRRAASLPPAVRRRLHFETADLTARELVPPRSLDGVLCAMALMHVPRAEPVVRAWARALRPSGRLLVVLPHPCFMGPKTHWSARLPQVPRGALPELEALQVFDYPERGRQAFRFSSEFAAVTVNHHRSLETMQRALAASGFLTRRLDEPRPSMALVRRDARWEPYRRVPFFLVWEAVLAGRAART
jgi:SAM-dependent methyltransferase